MGDNEMNIYKNMVRVATIVLLFCLSACIAPQGATLRQVNDQTIDITHPRAQLVLASKQLPGKLVVTNVRFGTVGNFTRTELDLQNLSTRKLNLEYRIIWQDKDGFTINSNNAWHRITLSPKQINSVQSVGKDPEAYRIQVVVRLPDDLFIESHRQESK